MVGAAHLTFLDDPWHHRSSPASRSCALATALEFARHTKKRTFPRHRREDVELQTVRARNARFSGLQKRHWKCRDSERAERVVVAGTETWKA